MKRLFYKTIHYKTVSINTQRKPEASLLMIYTGGTLGMVYDQTNKHLVPFDFEQILNRIPEIAHFGYNLTVISFNQLIDSSNVTPAHWVALATLIEENYEKYDGFVILHGTDTMAYSASALSFLLEGLNKPVVFTGSQLPIGATRTDARENLITTLEIAAARKYDRPIVPEVSIFFDSVLLRGNRSRKTASADFAAFESQNYPKLAKAGIRIDYNEKVIMPYRPMSTLKVHKKMDSRIAILKLFPGISPEVVESILNIPKLKGVVMETYGSGNAPTENWFLRSLESAIDRGIIILNVSQCYGGKVIQGRYETSKMLADIGILSGSDITTEAALTKMMYLLSQANSNNIRAIKEMLTTPLRGEITP